MRGLWRSQEDHRSPDRATLDHQGPYHDPYVQSQCLDRSIDDGALFKPISHEHLGMLKAHLDRDGNNVTEMQEVG